MESKATPALRQIALSMYFSTRLPVILGMVASLLFFLCKKLAPSNIIPGRIDELDGRAESSKSAHLRRLRYVIRQFFLQVLRRKHLTFIQPSDSVLNNLLSLVLFKVTNEPIVKRLTR